MAASTVTGQLLGRIKTEMVTDLRGRSPDTARSCENYRPERIWLENDGVWHYWLLDTAPPVIHLDWDGRGWHVHSPDWIAKHVYHLAGPSGWVGYLPMDDGDRVELDQAYRYELHTVRPAPGQIGWELYQIG
jgi:hypothetical protein